MIFLVVLVQTTHVTGVIWDIGETHMKRAIFLRGKRSRDFAIEYRAKRSLRSCRVHACGAVRPMQREHAAQPYHRFMWWIDQVRFSYVLPSVRVWTSCARDSVVCHIDFGWVELGSSRTLDLGCALDYWSHHVELATGRLGSLVICS
jgi:hypothetical protein